MTLEQVRTASSKALLARKLVGPPWGRNVGVGGSQISSQDWPRES